MDFHNNLTDRAAHPIRRTQRTMAVAGKKDGKRPRCHENPRVIFVGTVIKPDIIIRARFYDLSRTAQRLPANVFSPGQHHLDIDIGPVCFYLTGRSIFRHDFINIEKMWPRKLVASRFEQSRTERRQFFDPGTQPFRQCLYFRLPLPDISCIHENPTLPE